MTTQTCRVYVGNLSWKVKWQDLKDHMKKAGDVVRADVFVDPSGRSKGCGLVEYSNPADAQRAINELTDSQLFDRPVFVREDREEENVRGSRPSGSGGQRSYGSYSNGGNYNDRSYNGRSEQPRNQGGRREYSSGNYRDSNRGGYNSSRNFYGGDRNDDIRGRQVFVSNLPYRTGWQDLKDLMRECGDIVRADVLSHPDGRSKGVGTVLFADEEAAVQATERFNGCELEGRVIGVKIDLKV